MRPFSIPADVAGAVSSQTAKTLKLFLEFSSELTGSPEEAETRLFTTLSLSLSGRGGAH